MANTTSYRHHAARQIAAAAAKHLEKARYWRGSTDSDMRNYAYAEIESARRARETAHNYGIGVPLTVSEKIAADEANGNS